MRAFHAYLNAFRLAPEDEEIAEHLWRLATLIGTLSQPRTGSRGSAPGRGRIIRERSGLGGDRRHSHAGVRRGHGRDRDRRGGHRRIDGVARETPGHTPARQRGAGDALARMGAGLRASAGGSDHATHLSEEAGRDLGEGREATGDMALATLERAFRLQSADLHVRAEMERLAAAGDLWDRVCDTPTCVRPNNRRAPKAVELHLPHWPDSREPAAGGAGRGALPQGPGPGTATTPRRSIAWRRWFGPKSVGRTWRRSWNAGSRFPADDWKAPRRASGRSSWPTSTSVAWSGRTRRVDTLERCVSSCDDEEKTLSAADERRPALVQEARAGYAALARLYGRVGMAQKAATALQRELELTSEDSEAREARWRLAQICEHELAQPGRAVEIYEDILEHFPKDTEALAALDRLHLAMGHFETLAEVFASSRRVRRGQRQERVGVWRRARILEEKLGNPEAAAGCLRSLGPDALSDEQTASALLRNLRNAGLAHEALRIIEQRIDVLSKAGEDPKLIAALNLEMAQIKSDDLADSKGAEEAIEAALELMPEDSTALSALARFYLKNNDFQSYASVLLRRADALAGSPDQAAALLEAGAVFRDQLGQSVDARSCFDRAVHLHPNNVRGAGGHGCHVDRRGQHRDEAKELYERQLALSETPAAKAAVLTNLARALCEKPRRSGRGRASFGRGPGLRSQPPARGHHHGRHPLPRGAVGNGLNVV